MSQSGRLEIEHTMGSLFRHLKAPVSSSKSRAVKVLFSFDMVVVNGWMGSARYKLVMADAFSEREQVIMAYAWQCFEEQPKIDYVKLASLVGMSNPRSATNAWLNIKKKLALRAKATDAASFGEGNEVATPTASKKRKGGDDNSANSTPTPAKRGRKSKKATQDDDGEDTMNKESIIKIETDVNEAGDDGLLK
nr:hypothetical protein CFP56_09261 [Quercus suber]